MIGLAMFPLREPDASCQGTDRSLDSLGTGACGQVSAEVEICRREIDTVSPIQPRCCVSGSWEVDSMLWI